MDYIKYALLITLTALFFLACSDGGLATFDNDEGLKSEFPISVFEFSFDYISMKGGEELSNLDSLQIPIPFDSDSFVNFEATSDVKNNEGIRYVESILLQNLYGIPDSASFANNIFKYNYTDESKMIIKLNVATSGDAINGELYEKFILMDFLEEGKNYPTEKDQLGAIELMYRENNSHSTENNGQSILVGIDQYENIGESEYTVKVISVEDYEDLTREGDLIKSALKVVIEFEGLIGVSSNLTLPDELMRDQWRIQNGRASFIIDYLQ